jgi:hypothetical protein
MKTVIRTNGYLHAALAAILVAGACAVLAQPRNRMELNENAFTFAMELRDRPFQIAKAGGPNIGLQQMKRMSSFVFMDSHSTPTGI